MTLGRKLAYTLATVVVVLGLAELALRLAIPRDVLLFSGEHPGSTLRFPEPGVAIPRPDVSKGNTDGPIAWTESINSLGLRESKEITPKKPSGTRRYLALGDSWVYGISTDQGMAFVDHLETLLPERLGVESVEVINAGTPGGSAFEMLFWWTRLSTEFELDGVILGQPHNAVRYRTDSHKKYREAWYRSFHGAPPVDIRLYLVLRLVIAKWRRRPYPYLKPGEETTAAITDVLNLAHEARVAGKDVFVVLFPNNSYQDAASIERSMAGWYLNLERDDLPYTGHALTQRSCWGYEDRHHPGEAGQRAIAEVVADLIAGGEVRRGMRTEPSCDDVEGRGPGKPGSPVWRGR
jgi:hypothetical protein